jgi:hypothetical protein
MAPKNGGSVVDDRTKNMPQSVLECRDLGHPWKRKDAGFLIAERGRGRYARVVEREVECGNCGTTRKDTYAINRAGYTERTARRYKYADGYLQSRGDDVKRERLRRGMVQYALLTRLYPDLSW